ncbi:MAG: CrcB family protein [Acidobacteriota bacterium]|nr:CrcB family protein [Acidobacteriota bacterium]MDE3044561.1 CrcB family protein [Acidobacteriota bacterium]MDE3107495.1 CrcB family protein [Acidobacteriota bacterium]MDE3223564.1 CrcB family protein [Acidobacteriota bacterium]
MTALLVALAGGVGAVVRFVMEYVVRRRHPTQRPWATVAANVVGTALAGYGAYRLTGLADVHLRSVVLTGVCGGMTTFSSAFAVPAIIAREHHPRYAVALVLATPLLCCGGFLVGMSLAH